MSMSAAYVPIGKGPGEGVSESRTRWMRTGAFMVACFLGAAFGLRSADDRGSVADSVLEASSSSSSSFSSVVELTHEDFLDVSSVCSWIEDFEDVDDCKSLSTKRLLKYVPRLVSLKYDATLVKRSIGEQAEEGFLVFNLCHFPKGIDSLTASWILVLSYKGAIKQMEPVYKKDAVYRAMGLKMWDDSSVLLGIGKENAERGYPYTMDWRTGELSRLVDKEIDSHDLQHEGFVAFKRIICVLKRPSLVHHGCQHYVWVRPQVPVEEAQRVAMLCYHWQDEVFAPPQTLRGVLQRVLVAGHGL